MAGREHMSMSGATFDRLGKRAARQLRGQGELADTLPPTWEELQTAFQHVERVGGELKDAKERVKELTEEYNGAREHLRKLGWRMRYRQVDADTGEVFSGERSE
jgi:hypothetical protein